MNARAAWIIALGVVVAALIVAGAIYVTNRPSYSERLADCQAQGGDFLDDEGRCCTSDATNLGRLIIEKRGSQCI